MQAYALAGDRPGTTTTPGRLPQATVFTRMAGTAPVDQPRCSPVSVAATELTGRSVDMKSDSLSPGAESGCLLTKKAMRMQTYQNNS